MTDAERISALQSLSYSEREAAFLCLAALHSGYFLRRQYHSFAGVESGKAALLLEEKLVEKRHAKAVTFAYGTQLYHLCSRPFYEALGESNNRHRRSRAPLSIKAKLMGLDYVLGNPGRCWLATEREKLAYFVGRLGVDESFLPVRIYLSKGARKTEQRFFVEKYPIFAEAEHRPASPVVSFCYVDEGVLSTSGFESFLGRYRDLFRCLARVRLVYVAASLWLFHTAREKFTKFVSRLQSPGEARVCRELAEYFRLRGLVEADHYDELDTDHLDRLREYMKRFAAPRFEARYQSQKTAPDQPECRQTGPLEVAFETCLLPHDYDIFATAEPESSGQPHGVNGSCTTVRGETPFATGFHRKRS